MWGGEELSRPVQTPDYTHIQDPSLPHSPCLCVFYSLVPACPSSVSSLQPCFLQVTVREKWEEEEEEEQNEKAEKDKVYLVQKDPP